MRKFAAVVALSLGVAGQAMAADLSSAVLSADPTNSHDSILVSRDGRFSSLVGPRTTLHKGDRIVVRNGTGASLAFADQCVVRVAPGSMVTIGSASPCADAKGGFKQVASPCDTSGWTEGDYALLTLGLVGGGLLICWAAGCFNSHHQSVVSP
jgi:hypothetical protein